MHVYVKKIISTSALRNSLSASPGFSSIFDNDQVVVYQSLLNNAENQTGVVLQRKFGIIDKSKTYDGQ